MKFNKVTRRRLVTAASLIAPVLMVQFVRWASNASSEPSSAHAAAPAPAPSAEILPVDSPAMARLSKEQQALIKWVRSQPDPVGMRSPMDHGEPKPVSVATHEPRPIDAPPPVKADPAAELAAKLSVGAIFGGQPQMVTINGRVYSTGDEVVPDWRVSNIDPRNGTVELEGPDGRSIELRVLRK